MRVLGKRESKGTHDNANLIDENTKVKELDNKSFCASEKVKENHSEDITNTERNELFIILST